MATSTLDPDNIPEPDRQLGKGHGTGALGPSDISDTGSDVQGGRSWAQEADIGLDKGTHEDPDSGLRGASVHPNLGDGDIDDDTDASRTGQRGTAGRDSDIEMGGDIGVDRIDDIGLGEDLDLEDAGTPPSRPRNPDHPQQQR